MPLQINAATAPREGRNLSTIARLRPNVSVRAAQADMERVAALTERQRPAMNAHRSATVVMLIDQAVGQVRPALLVLLGAVICVLLVACANVANLMLMRATVRAREMTVRLALGAGRWRLVHQLAIKSLLLAGLGGVLGLTLAHVGAGHRLDAPCS